VTVWITVDLISSRDVPCYFFMEAWGLFCASDGGKPHTCPRWIESSARHQRDKSEARFHHSAWTVKFGFLHIAWVQLRRKDVAMTQFLDAPTSHMDDHVRSW